MVLPMAPFYLVLIAPGINVQSTGGATSGIFSMQYVSRTKPPHSHTFFISVNWHNHSNKLIMSDLVLTKSKSPSMKDRWKDCRYPPPPIWDMSCRGGVWACGAPCWTDCELLFVGFPPALCCSFASKWSRNAGLYCVLLLPVLPRAATSTQLIHLLSSYSNNICNSRFWYIWTSGFINEFRPVFLLFTLVIYTVIFVKLWIFVHIHTLSYAIICPDILHSLYEWRQFY